jgi:drug/metabolite transporter (DMT)-like permease
MSWITIIILAYFLFAITALLDKYILIGPINPKSYVFYIGILGLLVLFLIPFVNFSIPGIYIILLCFLAGSFSIFAIYVLYEGLERFEATRVVPAIGGILPLFTFILVYLFSGGREVLNPLESLAFFLLLLGSILITMEFGKRVSFQSLKISAAAAFLFSFFFVLAKYVYLLEPFWNGFIWIKIGGVLTAFFFIFFKEVRAGIFSRKKLAFDKKTGILFLLNQAIGALAFILQNWAVALAGLAYLSIINAFQGIQYVFLFIFMIILPRVFEEKISLKIILQKVLAIFFIGAGLLILSL